MEMSSLELSIFVLGSLSIIPGCSNYHFRGPVPALVAVYFWYYFFSFLVSGFERFFKIPSFVWFSQHVFSRSFLSEL